MVFIAINILCSRRFSFLFFWSTRVLTIKTKAKLSGELLDEAIKMRIFLWNLISKYTQVRLAAKVPPKQRFREYSIIFAFLKIFFEK